MSIVVHEPASVAAESVEDVMRMAQLLVSSRLLPRSIATPEAAFAIILTGRELGLSPMTSLRTIHVIEGKPCLSADLILGLVKRRSDVCASFRLVESTPSIATYETLRTGETAPTKMSFTLEEARAAGLTGKDNWRKYPAAMLRARCIAALSRAVYPDIAMGLYDPDELSQSPLKIEGQAEVLDARPSPADSGSLVEPLLASLIAAGDLDEAIAGIAKAKAAGELDDVAMARLRKAYSEAKAAKVSA